MTKGTVLTIDHDVGRRIRERRREMGVSQEMLAAAIEISFQQLQKYESGKNRVAVGRLAQIAAALEVPEQWFFGRSGFPWPGEDRRKS